MPRDSGRFADLHFISGALGDRSREANNLFNLCPALGQAPKRLPFLYIQRPYVYTRYNFAYTVWSVNGEKGISFAVQKLAIVSV